MHRPTLGKILDLHTQTPLVPHLLHPIGVLVLAQPTIWSPPMLTPYLAKVLDLHAHTWATDTPIWQT